MKLQFLLAKIISIIKIISKISFYFQVIKAYKFREKNAKYFADLNPHIERNVFEKNVFAVLPYRDNYGRRTIIIEAGSKFYFLPCISFVYC